jgi:predicted 3-demethylubiquinone-9 3-methyltransferase (glyoxalase superfamily)
MSPALRVRLIISTHRPRQGGRDVKPIYPMLWFDTQAEEAANHYVAVFPDAKINGLTRYGPAGPRAEGSVMTVDLELNGGRFVLLNGGPEFAFNPSVSFVIECDGQAEVDTIWAGLVDGGQEQPCGWLQDRYGVSWQVVPSALLEMLTDSDAQKAERVNAAMLQVVGKFDIASLRAAFEGR